uniref:Pentacotripeptide-repeat region of PRORP domain-containing protein n=2 Tax=Oryza glaberrima TaxID=4538 RepID=I1NZT7_ORYGL
MGEERPCRSARLDDEPEKRGRCEPAQGSPPTRSRTPRSSRRSPARTTSTTHSPFCHSWRMTPWLPTSCSSPTSSTSPSARATRPRRSCSSPVFGARGAAGIKPDLKAYNAAIAAYCKSDLLRDTNRLLLHDMPSNGVAPDAESYSPMRRAGVAPSVVTYNTMLRVYGDAALFGEAVHLFGLMRSAASDGSDRGGSIIKPNVVTYNTMIAIYGMSLGDEKAGSLVQDMQANGISVQKFR